MFVDGHTYATHLTLISSAILAFIALTLVCQRYFSFINDTPGPFLGSYFILW
jgi:hypothetical protein